MIDFDIKSMFIYIVYLVDLLIFGIAYLVMSKFVKKIDFNYLVLQCLFAIVFSTLMLPLAEIGVSNDEYTVSMTIYVHFIKFFVDTIVIVSASLIHNTYVRKSIYFFWLVLVEILLFRIDIVLGFIFLIVGLIYRWEHKVN